MNRNRFVRLLWSTLGVYEFICLFLAWIVREHPPSFLPSVVSSILEASFVLAMLLPAYLFLSFRGILPRKRGLNLLFFLFYFSSGVFLAGLLVAELGITIHNSLLPAATILPRERWTLGEEGGAALLLFLFGLSIFERMRPPRLIRKSLVFPDIHPDLSGTTILHLSDLHVGAWQGEESLRRIARMVDSLSPDILTYTGDLIDHREEEAVIFERNFGHLKGGLGTFAVLGNHEYWTLGSRAQGVMMHHGVPILKNENRVIRRGLGTVRVVGIDDPAGEEECPGCGPDVGKSLDGAEPKDFVLALVHQPTLWEGELKRRAHLTVAGHTHGGQIGGRRPFWNLARIFFQYDAGWFEEMNPSVTRHLLHVSTGLGYYGIPVRLGMAPEMTLITLISPKVPANSFGGEPVPNPV